MTDDPPRELWYTDELESDPVVAELLEILRDKLGQVVDEIWELRVRAFNKRFQEELEKALRDYIENASFHWLWIEDNTLMIEFGYTDAADHIPPNHRPLKELLEEFAADWDEDHPEVARVKRLLEAWDA